jgi:NTP pyrophosphatase (non-canonical NTP hydrolase)
MKMTEELKPMRTDREKLEILMAAWEKKPNIMLSCAGANTTGVVAKWIKDALVGVPAQRASDTLFNRESRGAGYYFVTAPAFPGWSFMLTPVSPKAREQEMRLSFVAFLEAEFVAYRRVHAEGATDRGQFASLRAANEVRQREWDVLGQLTLAYRGNELAGEVGEACNVIKKLERERLGINGSRDTVEHLAEELADVIICTDLIAMQAGIDLEGAVVAKFNASSEKVGLKTRMVRRQSPAASASELPAWEDPRVQTVYNMLCDPALDTPPNPEEHWEGWVSRNIVKALCPSQPETDAEVFMASNAALTSEVLQLRAQVERLTAALTEIEDLGVDGATGARLANIATQALSPLPFEPKKERKPKLSPQDRRTEAE